MLHASTEGAGFIPALIPQMKSKINPRNLRDQREYFHANFILTQIPQIPQIHSPQK